MWLVLLDQTKNAHPKLFQSVALALYYLAVDSGKTNDWDLSTVYIYLHVVTKILCVHYSKLPVSECIYSYLMLCVHYSKPPVSEYRESASCTIRERCSSSCV